MHDETGEAPLLLLDDVMSELDAHRRATLLTALAGVNQAVLTTTDWADFSPDFRAEAQLLAVGDGEIRPGGIRQVANNAELTHFTDVPSAFGLKPLRFCAILDPR